MATPPPHFDALVDGIRERSDGAFSDLYRVMADRLLSYAYGMLRDRQAAEDSVQQAFVELAGSADSFGGDGTALRSWLYRSVRFNCLDEVRRRKRHPELPTEVLPDSTPSEDRIELGFDPQLEAAFDKLSDQQRSIMVLKNVLGFSGDEIAAILGVSRSGVYASATRAERRLRKLLAPVEFSAGAASQCVEDRP